MTWYVYVVECADHTLYTGVSTCPDRRVDEHNNSSKGAKYTRTRRPVELVWLVICADRSRALVIEAKIKKMRRAQKLAIISGKL